jgi:putative ABC transport system permease protein
VLLVEHLIVAACGAAAGLLAGWAIAPLLTSTGAGLVGAPGAPAVTASTILTVGAMALTVAATSSFVPAVRAAHTSTVAALADAPRVPPRRRLVIALSARFPVPLLLALRQFTRRPRRAVLHGLSVTVTVTGIAAILTSYAHNPGATQGIDNLKIDRLDELTAIITVMLAILAAVNTTFIAWSTAADARFSSALERALGASAGQVTAGLSMAPLMTAVPGAIAGLPLGVAAYHLLAPGLTVTVPPWWQLAALFTGCLLAISLLTAVPSRFGARRPPAPILQSE